MLIEMPQIFKCKKKIKIKCILIMSNICILIKVTYAYSYKMYKDTKYDTYCQVCVKQSLAVELQCTLCFIIYRSNVHYECMVIMCLSSQKIVTYFHCAGAESAHIR